MNIVWRVAALDGLERARAFLAEHNPSAAARILESILTAVNRLVAMPRLGRPGRVEGTRELVVPRTPYIVAYTVNNNEIAILAVQHGAQFWPERF